MDPRSDTRSASVVRRLVKLPVIDRVKAIKDLVLHELAAIHSQVLAVHAAADTLLATEGPLRTELGAIHERVRAVHAAADALLANEAPLLRKLAAIHSQLLAVHAATDTLLANDSPLLQSSISLVEALQQTRLEIEAGTGRAQELLDALRAAHVETTQEAQRLLRAVRDGQQSGERHVQTLLETLRSAHEESTQREHLLAETLREGQHSAERQGERLVSAVRQTHEETKQHLHVLMESLKRTHDATEEQGALLLHALNETRERAAQQSRLMETALDTLQGAFDGGRQRRRTAPDQTRIEPAEILSGNAILLRSGPSVEEPEVGLMAHLYSYLPSRIAVDVGASGGDLSNRLLQCGYHVYAFEPNPTVFPRLGHRLSKHADFHCFPWALGSVDDTRPLHLASGLPGSNRRRDSASYSNRASHSVPDDLVLTDSVPVVVRRLETLHATGHIPLNLGLVTIDTEGSDLEVIQGMGPHRYPVVVATYWDQAVSSEEPRALNRLEGIVHEMKGKGYHWYLVLYRIWGKEGVSFYCNHDHPAERAYGHAFFFQDHSVFTQALMWCSAVLPATYITR